MKYMISLEAHAEVEADSPEEAIRKVDSCMPDSASFGSESTVTVGFSHKGYSADPELPAVYELYAEPLPEDEGRKGEDGGVPIRFAALSIRYKQDEAAGVTVALCRMTHLRENGTSDGIVFGAKGVARLSPDDVWDAEEGKQAAIHKAFLKALPKLIERADGVKADCARCEDLLKTARQSAADYAICRSDALKAIAIEPAAIKQFGGRNKGGGTPA